LLPDGDKLANLVPADLQPERLDALRRKHVNTNRKIEHLTTIISAETMDDMRTRSEEMRDNAPQLERDAWTLRAESYGQLFILCQAVQANRPGATDPLDKAIQSYIVSHNSNGVSGFAGDRAKELFKACNEFLAQNGDDDQIVELLEACSRSIELGKCYDQVVNLTNRAMTLTIPAAASRVFKDWLSGQKPASSGV
jgi:hypothetical protein